MPSLSFFVFPSSSMRDPFKQSYLLSPLLRFPAQSFAEQNRTGCSRQARTCFHFVFNPPNCCDPPCPGLISSPLTRSRLRSTFPPPSTRGRDARLGRRLHRPLTGRILIRFSDFFSFIYLTFSSACSLLGDPIPATPLSCLAPFWSRDLLAQSPTAGSVSSSPDLPLSDSSAVC